MRNKLKKEKSSGKILLTLIIILGLSLRIFPALNLETWVDEAYTFFASKQTFWGLIWLEPVHPPLFYWLIKFWSQIRTDVFFLRIPSLMFSLINFFLVYLISKEVNYNKYFPFLAVFLFGISYLNIEQAFQVRMYAFVLMLMLLSLLFFLKILFDSSNKSKLFLFLFSLTNFLGILADYAFIWYYLALFSTVIIFLVLKRKDFSKKQIILLEYCFWISSSLMICWLPIFVSNLHRALNFLYKPTSFFMEVKGLFLSNQIGLLTGDIIHFLTLFVITSFSGCFLFRFALNLKKTKESFFWLMVNLFFYLTFLFGTIIFLLSGSAILSSRNMLIGTFFPIFSLAGLISFLWLQNKFYLKFSGLIILFFVVFTSLFSLKNSYLYKSKIFYEAASKKDAVDFIKNKANLDSDTLIFTPRWDRLVFDYYFLGYDQNRFFTEKYKSQIYKKFPEDKKLSIYWFVNFDHQYFHKHYQGEEKLFLNECLMNREEFFYKNAYFLRCKVN